LLRPCFTLRKFFRLPARYLSRNGLRAAKIKTIMAQRDNLRNITLTDEIVLKLLKKGLDKGFKNFKNFAEHILIAYAEAPEENLQYAAGGKKSTK
jgi:hypothetical protein